MKLERPLFVAGAPLSTDRSVEIRAPWDGELLGAVALAGPEECLDAARHAVDASPLTRAISPRRRAYLLDALAGWVLSEHETLAQLIRAEAGKPIALARAEVDAVVALLEAAADTAERPHVSLDATPGHRVAVTRSSPRGPLLALTSACRPLAAVCARLGEALAAGCPIVFCPDLAAPSAALALVAPLLALGWPPEAVSVLPAEPDVLRDLVLDPRFAVVYLDGACRTPAALQAGRRGLLADPPAGVTLVVEPDADLSLVFGELVRGTFAHAGQLRPTVERVLVHEDIWDVVCAGVAEAARSLPRGDPARDDVVCGPMLAEPHLARVEAWLAANERRGATRIAGGEREGTVLAPTVLTAQAPFADVLDEDVCGPVAVLEPYTGLEAALDRINRRRPGGAAGLYTRSLRSVWAAFEHLHGGALVHDAHPDLLTVPLPRENPSPSVTLARTLVLRAPPT